MSADFPTIAGGLFGVDALKEAVIPDLSIEQIRDKGKVLWRSSARESEQVAESWGGYQDGVGNAVTRSQQRMTAASAGTGVSVVFGELKSFGDVLFSVSQELAELSATARRAMTDPNLVASTVISPVSAARAGASLVAAATSLTLGSAALTTLALQVRSASKLYRTADQILAQSAAGLVSAADIGFANSWGLVKVGVSAADGFHDYSRSFYQQVSATLGGGLAIGALGTSTISALQSATAFGAGALGGAATLTAYQSVSGASREILRNPLAFSSWRRSGQQFGGISQRFGANLKLTANTMSQDTFDDITGSLVFVAGLGRRIDKAVLIEPDAALAKKLEDNTRSIQATLDDTSYSGAHSPPRTLPQLIASMAMIDGIGAEDASVIRVLKKKSNPPVFTVIIPSTKSWSTQGTVANDLTGNLGIVQGDSALLRLADEALQRSLQETYPTKTDFSDVKIMVAGFSQGGITAAAFAEEYQSRYNIEQVVAVGSPISRFTKIPESTRVLAIESTKDMVPKVDGAENPKLPNWKTWSFDEGKHNALDYASNSEGSNVEPIQQYLDAGNDTLEFKDYYGLRSR